MLDFAVYFSQGLPYAEFLQRYGSGAHRERWARVHAAVQLNDAQRGLLAGFKRQMKVLCVAGAWCGDCVEQCPIWEHFAQGTPTIDLRFVDRDAHPELTAELAVCGGARVPIVVFLSEDDQHVARYGDRTLARYRQLAAAQLGAACPTGIAAPPAELLSAVTQDWLNEFERVQLLLRLSPRLRQKHGD